MSISLFDIVGPIMIGPSSSHTAGAARLGEAALRRLGHTPELIEITLYNSFADTGKGHGTDKAIIAGCIGISCFDARLKNALTIATEQKIKYKINYKKNEKYHPNTAEIKLQYKKNVVRILGVSLGGGRVQLIDIEKKQKKEYLDDKNIKNINSEDCFYSFSNNIKDHKNEPDKLIHKIIEREIMVENKSIEKITDNMYEVWQVMKEGITENIKNQDKIFKGLCGGDAFKMKFNDNSEIISKISSDAIAYAIAIGERNANMGKIVAVPTAGSAGIIPGCLYSLYRNKKINEEKIIKSLFVAGGIGLTIALRATLAGSEGGCQAECGSAAAMAAGAIAYLYGGSVDTIDNAASLALSNCLGLVCDPISGLVAVPCIHRNGVFANLAISSAVMALSGIDFVVSLDEVIDAMFAIGKSLPCALKETSKGGLAITKTGLKYNELLRSRQTICQNT